MKVVQTCMPKELKERLDEKRGNFSMSSYICNILAKHIQDIDAYRGTPYKKKEKPKSALFDF
jgi:predicted DNA-binding protein